MLIFESILVGCLDGTSESKDDDRLATAAALYKIDAKVLSAAVAKEAREKAEKKAKKPSSKVGASTNVETNRQVT